MANFSFVLATLNCCREKIKEEKFSKNNQSSKQVFFKFAATPSNLAISDENFGKKYAEILEKEINEGFLIIPYALDFFDYGETSQKMSKPVALVPFDGRFDPKQLMEKIKLERIKITEKREWAIVSTNGIVEVSSLRNTLTSFSN
jgi:hypothetical protein